MTGNATNIPNIPLSTGVVTITTSGFCFTMNRWSFCPDCGTRLPVEWKHCAGCGKLIGAETPQITSHYITNPATPWTFTDQAAERCAFDGLPPGAYNLVCMCPKCSPRC